MNPIETASSVRQCPPLDEVVAHALGERVSAPVVAHLTAGCRRCAGLAARLQPLRRELAVGPIAPGRDAHAAVLQLADECRGEQAGAVQVAAAIDRTAPVVRGGGGAERWRFFRAEPFEVDLCLREAGQVVGTLSGPAEREADWLDAEAVLVGEGGSFEARIDEFGDFEFPAMPAGPAHLGLHGASFELLIPELSFD